MKKHNSSLALFIRLVGLSAGVFLSNVVFAQCTGTYYARAYADGPDKPVTAYGLWTFASNGSVVSGNDGEPEIPFGTGQGNWKPVAPNKIKVKTFSFSGDPAPTYPDVARIEATIKFKDNCSATVAGKSLYNVTLCPVADGPLCTTGTPVVVNSLIELVKISGN